MGYFKKETLGSAEDNHYIINKQVENDSEEADVTFKNVLPIFSFLCKHMYD